MIQDFRSDIDESSSDSSESSSDDRGRLILSKNVYIFIWKKNSGSNGLFGSFWVGEMYGILI